MEIITESFFQPGGFDQADRKPPAEDDGPKATAHTHTQKTEGGKSTRHKLQ